MQGLRDLGLDSLSAQMSLLGKQMASGLNAILPPELNPFVDEEDEELEAEAAAARWVLEGMQRPELCMHASACVEFCCSCTACLQGGGGCCGSRRAAQHACGGGGPAEQPAGSGQRGGTVAAQCVGGLHQCWF